MILDCGRPLKPEKTRMDTTRRCRHPFWSAGLRPGEFGPIRNVTA